MNRILSLVLFSRLIFSAGAAGNGAGVFQRAGCKANECLLAVVMEAVQQTDGVEDCKNFQTTTVTPCPSFATQTTTVTVTSAIDTTSGGTTVVVVPSTTHVSGTVTATVTIASANSTNFMWKRAAPSQPLMNGGLGFNFFGKRQSAGCEPVLSIQTAVPSYATACPNTNKYASACNCLGITAKIKILDAVTSTIQVTATAVVNVTATAFQTVSSVSVVTAADTTIYTTVSDGPLQTISPYGLMSRFYLKEDQSDMYLFAESTDPGQRLMLKEGLGMIEETDADGFLQLSAQGHPFFANVALTGHDTINTVNATDQSLPAILNNRVKCLCGGTLGGSGPLTCAARNGQNYLQTCGDGLLYISQGAVSGCSPVSLSCYPLSSS